MAAPRKAAWAEESAEVEVLFATMEKWKTLTKKIQGSMNRLETSGTSVQDAITPIYSNTQRLQVQTTNIESCLSAIERIRQPLDRRNKEDSIIKAGPKGVGLQDYIASLDRTTQALGDLKQTNMRSNQNAIGELNTLVKSGTKQLEDVFRDTLREDAKPLEPLQYITKNKPFPTIPQEKLSNLRLMSSHISASVAQTGDARDSPAIRTYAEVRGDYISTSLRNLAAASISTARKVSADEIYRKGKNAIGSYAQGMEGLFVAEYDNICHVFTRDVWGPAFTATSQTALSEFQKTLRELNTHITNNLLTDCFLGYEIIEEVSSLSLRIEDRTGELKRPIADSIKTIREIAKKSLSAILEDTRNSVLSLVSLPMDGSSVPITVDTMTKLQTMSQYLAPLASIMTSLGDGGWKSASATASSNSIPTLKSFDVGADGKELFSHFATDVIDTLLQNLEAKSKMLLKGRSLQGVFLTNNVAVVDRMIRQSDLQPLLSSAGPRVDSWRKKGTAMYLDAWKEPSAYLLDVQYTNRGAGGRPHSNSVSTVDSAAVVKGLSSKDKDAIKKKFTDFNNSFDDLIARHKALNLEKEVRITLARDIHTVLEPLYNRFWDRYHEIDKGKGKYVKYDKQTLASALNGLAA